MLSWLFPTAALPAPSTTAPATTAKRKRQLTEAEKTDIISLARRHENISDIATRFGKTPRTIYNVLRNGDDGIARKPGSGAPLLMKHLLLTGAGTQQALTASSRCWDESMVDNIFIVDASLDSLSGSFSHSYAHISLNVSWKFPNSFHLHGTVPDGTLVAVDQTEKYVQAALSWLRDRWGDNLGEIQLTIIGVGLSGRNGRGIFKLFEELNISAATVVDIAPMMNKRRERWLKENITTTPFEYISEHADVYVKNMIGTGRNGWPSVKPDLPTIGDIEAGYMSKEAAKSLQTADPVVTDLVHNHILRPNSWCVKNISLTDTLRPRLINAGRLTPLSERNYSVMKLVDLPSEYTSNLIDGKLNVSADFFKKVCYLMLIEAHVVMLMVNH